MVMDIKGNLENIVKNFIKNLLDTKFENYITLRILGVLLIIAYIFDAILIMYLCSSYNFLKGLLMFIILYPITLIIIRINFEALSALIKVAENTSKIDKKLESLEILKEKCQNIK